MTFNPSQVRVPAGGAGGGQFGGQGSGSASKKTAAKKKAAPSKFGTARNAAAAKAQQDKAAQQFYGQMMKAQGGQQAAFAKSLPDADLEKLTAILYSSPTSDPAIVQARIVVANEMSKRGLDVKKFGALGGGPVRKATAKRAPKVPGRTFKAPAAKVAPKAAPAAPAPAPAPRSFGPGRRAY